MKDTRYVNSCVAREYARTIKHDEDVRNSNLTIVYNE
jgi:hypothetical protein